MRISDWSSDVCSSDLIHIPAGTTASISTGLTIAVPAGLEAQARASSSLPDGLLVQRLRAAAIGERQEITVVVSNVGTEVITVRPGDMIAQLTFKSGRASCRERVVNVVLLSVVTGLLKQKKKKKQ